MTDQYFVNIKDPQDVRRGLLSNSRRIIQILQRYERIKELRIKKVELLSKMRGINKEINLLVTKLKKEMPKAEIRVKNKPRDTERAPRRSINELEKLESELKEIEEKIGMIS